MAANNPRLEIEISVSGMAQASKDFSSLRKRLEESQQEFNKANATARGLEGELKSLSSTLASGGITQKQYNKDAKEIGVALASARQAAKGYQANISSLTATLAQGDNIGRQYGNSIGKLQGVHDSVSKGIRGSTTIGVEFGRVLSDLPYGIQGVANNIQQLGTNLGYYTKNLKESLAEQGKQVTTGALVRGVLSSLISPMALLNIGIAAITAGWVAYDKYQQKANKAAREAEDEFEKLAKSLNNVSTAQYQAAKSSGQEVAQLRILYQAATDNTRSINERRNAARQLINQYPEQFKQFGIEKTLLGDAKDAYDRLTTSILATARAQAAYGRIGEKASQQIAIDEANKALQQQIDLRRQQIQQNRARGAQVSGSIGLGTGADQAADLARQADALERSTAELNDISRLQQEQSKNLLTRARLQEDILDLEQVALSNQGKIIVNDTKRNDGLSKTNKSLKELNNLLGTQGNYYQDQVFKINQAYEELVANIKNSGASQDTIDKALGIAAARRETDLLLNRFQELFDTQKKIKNLGIGTPSGIVGSQSSDLAKATAQLEASTNNLSRRPADVRNQEDKRLENRLSRVVERGLRQGVESLFGSIDELGSNFKQVFSNVFQQLAGSLTRTFGNVLATQFGNTLSKSIGDKDFAIGSLSNNVSKAIVAGAGLAGGALLSQGASRGNSVVAGAGGALSGAAAGLGIASAISKTAGPIGAAVGGIIGLIGGIFSAGARKKELQIQEEQLAEQRKQTALQERQAALAYTSSIIGSQTNSGIVTRIDRDAFGNLTADISGDKLQIVLNRAKNQRG